MPPFLKKILPMVVRGRDMGEDVLDNLTVDLMIEHIARGHAFNKHILGEDKSKSMNGVNSLRAKHDNKGRFLGSDLKINTVLDLKHYINDLVDKEDTSGFVNPKDGSITLYQQSDNVIMHFNQNDRQHDYGSIYRYYNSRDDFYNKMALAQAIAEEDMRHQFTTLNNLGVAEEGIRSALSDMIIGIKDEPYKYTAKPDTRVVDARFIIALENKDRPGRKGMEQAPNNGVFHSGEYADIHERNIMGPLSINSSSTLSLLAVCEIKCIEEVEYSNISDALRERDDNESFEYEEGLDLF